MNWRLKRGFSLIELLIVVSIIGILITLSVPKLRSLVVRARQSEAKIALAGLHTAEKSFFGEWGVYGNHLKKVGFELVGDRRWYSVGFPNRDCTDQAVVPTTDEIMAKFPGYYQVDPGAPVTVYPRTLGVTSNSYCHGDITVAGANSPMLIPPDGGTFTASATSGENSPTVASVVEGPIFSPLLEGADNNLPEVPPAPENIDVWTITHQGVVTHNPPEFRPQENGMRISPGAGLE